MERIIKDETVWRREDTGQISLVRYRLERPSTSDGVSREQDIDFAQWNGVAGLLIGREFREGSWYRFEKLNAPITIHDCPMHYRVVAGKGKETQANEDEYFLFPTLPADVVKLEPIEDNLNALAQWIAKFSERTRVNIAAKAREREQDRRKQNPPHFPYEQPDVDHYDNQKDVMLTLVKKKWPHLSTAIADLRAADSEQKRKRAKTKVFHAYIADYKTIHDKMPKVQEGEAAMLYEEDAFHQLMSEALAAPLGTVDKRDWQLTQGWIEKGYYRMNETDLAAAFARDWDYAKPYKGSTLARTSRRLGLRSGLKHGRPETHTFDDSTYGNQRP
jgi:hypothetical protein